jgi:hypothetical protein
VKEEKREVKAAAAALEVTEEAVRHSRTVSKSDDVALPASLPKSVTHHPEPFVALDGSSSCSKVEYFQEPICTAAAQVNRCQRS